MFATGLMVVRRACSMESGVVPGIHVALLPSRPSRQRLQSRAAPRQPLKPRTDMAEYVTIVEAIEETNECHWCGHPSALAIVSNALIVLLSLTLAFDDRPYLFPCQ